MPVKSQPAPLPAAGRKVAAARYPKERMKMTLDCESIAGMVAGGPMVFDPGIGRGTQWQKGGRSPNPGGRPKSRALSEALRVKLAEVSADDPEHRTHAEIIAENLVRIASSDARGAITAAAEIGNRVEGRAHSVEISDFRQELRDKSDFELQYYLQYGCWPDDEQVATLTGSGGDAPK